jgi:class 3 adenylate cyclase
MTGSVATRQAPFAGSDSPVSRFAARGSSMLRSIESGTRHSAGQMPEPNEQPAPQRKQATIVFADLSGFTAMSEDMDPEQVRDVVNRYFESLSAAVNRYQGTVDKYIGDSVMAVFGVPATRENDCERACCAALDMQQAVRDLAAKFTGANASPPELHIGINTGLVVAGGMGSAGNSQYTVVGDAVNLASRLCHEAENGQIAIGESTWELVRHNFDCSAAELRSIKGKSDKIPVYFLQSRSLKPSNKRQFQVRMVGRAAEMALARDLMSGACAGRRSLLYVTGDAGIGKSRLSSEMSEWASQNGMRVLTASAEPLDTIQAYSLWRQLLERLGGARPANASHDAALRATAGLASHEFELLSEARRFDAIVLAWKDLLQSLQSERPLLLTLDDLQWADAQSLQLLDQMVEVAPTLAILICAQARPEFQHTWQSRADYHAIVLRPLSPEDSAELVRAALGDKDLAGGVSSQADVMGRADGNPFYLTELARAADRLGDGKLPPTIEGLIVERIDALEKEARRILELASVIGREFPNRLLTAVSETEQLEAQISRLEELEFVYQKEIAPELLYLFKHYLTQQATYESILIQRRKELGALGDRYAWTSCDWNASFGGGLLRRLLRSSRPECAASGGGQGCYHQESNRRSGRPYNSNSNSANQSIRPTVWQSVVHGIDWLRPLAARGETQFRV